MNSVTSGRSAGLGRRCGFGHRLRAPGRKGGARSRTGAQATQMPGRPAAPPRRAGAGLRPGDEGVVAGRRSRHPACPSAIRSRAMSARSGQLHPVAPPRRAAAEQLRDGDEAVVGQPLEQRVDRGEAGGPVAEAGILPGEERVVQQHDRPRRRALEDVPGDGRGVVAAPVLAGDAPEHRAVAEPPGDAVGPQVLVAVRRAHQRLAVRRQHRPGALELPGHRRRRQRPAATDGPSRGCRSRGPRRRRGRRARDGAPPGRRP